MIVNKALETPKNEMTLVAQAKADPAAFEAIYDFYFTKVYNYVRYRVWNPGLADDLTSDVFEKVLSKLHTYNPERGSFSAWLFAIARNTVNYSLRKQRIRQWLSLEQIHDLAGKEPDSDEAVIMNETRHELLMAIDQLSEREREIIALKFTSNLTNRAIASLTGLNEGHVAVLLHRAIRRIGAQLDRDEV